MTVQKFSAPEPSAASGFIVTDLTGAAAADGVVRCAKKVLLDGARTMARSRSYAWALLEQQRSGASAGISDAGDRAAGITAFLEAAAASADSGSLTLDAAKGLDQAELEPLAPGDPRHAGDDTELLAASLVESAAVASGGLEGRTVAIEGAGSALGPLVGALTASGALVTHIGLVDQTLVVEPDGVAAAAAALGPAGAGADALIAEGGAVGGSAPDAVLFGDVDVLICGSRLGRVDHVVADKVAAGVIVPVGPGTVTAKGLAVAVRRGATVLPDFLSAAGPLQRFLVEGPEAQLAAAAAAARRTREFLNHPEGPFLAACVAAESFLSTWQEELPFGRPLS